MDTAEVTQCPQPWLRRLIEGSKSGIDEADGH